MLAKCIDKYIALKTQQVEEPKAGVIIDPRLEDVVQRMFQRCFADAEYQQVGFQSFSRGFPGFKFLKIFILPTDTDNTTQAIGLALESFRLDIVEESVKRGDAEALLTYVLDASMTLVQHLDFRNKVSLSYINLLVQFNKN